MRMRNYLFTSESGICGRPLFVPLEQTVNCRLRPSGCSFGDQGSSGHSGSQSRACQAGLGKNVFCASPCRQKSAVSSPSRPVAAPDIPSSSSKDGGQDLVARPGIHFNHSRRLARRRPPRNHLFTVESRAFSRPLFVPSERRANPWRRSHATIAVGRNSRDRSPGQAARFPSSSATRSAATIRPAT